MKEMIKRRKDAGFTLIELMIVIAVIGILAVVLVPKVGSIKTQAKVAGIDTNIRTVQGYIQSKITSWNAAGLDADVIIPQIEADITDLVNPLDSGEDAIAVGEGAFSAATAVAGQVYITVTDDAVQIDIDAWDHNENALPEKHIEITP